MKHMLLAAVFTAAPAAAQMKARLPVQSPAVVSGLGASLRSSPIQPSLNPALAAPSLSPSVPVPGFTTPASPAVAERALSVAALADSAPGSPLDVIRDASADATEKSAALDRLFENPALNFSAAEAAPVPSHSAAASPVPEWFESAGLSFALMKKAADGYLMAVLRHGRYELGVFVDKHGDSRAIFTKYALNPMGTPLKEDLPLSTDASRRAVAGILRAAHAAHPVTGSELAALEETLARLDSGARGH